jgi:hypothetical protein
MACKQALLGSAHIRQQPNICKHICMLVKAPINISNIPLLLQTARCKALRSTVSTRLTLPATPYAKRTRALLKAWHHLTDKLYNMCLHELAAKKKGCRGDGKSDSPCKTGTKVTTESLCAKLWEQFVAHATIKTNDKYCMGN